jgi:hypothetical protein
MQAVSPAAVDAAYEDASHAICRPGRSGLMSRLVGVRTFIESASGAYMLIALLQLKVIWDDWKLRDLTIGDTSSYIQNAARWADRWMVDILWSPLYTMFFGVLLRVTGDAAAATWLHRTLITFAAALLVLAVFRQIMPPLAAWALAAWWCVLETAFNVRREVHLFAVLPLLLAMLVVVKIRGVWGRALALSVLALATVLVRNEFAVSTALVGIACAYYEIRQMLALGAGRWSFALRRIGVYALPMVVVAATVIFFYTRSIVQFPEIIGHSQPKHTLNICQVYAVGYMDRHDDWKLNPWLECPDLMQRQFGAPLPSLFAALQSNPPAMLEHFWWNLVLTPNGLQVALFNAMSGTVTPDYEPVPIDRTIVPALSIGLLAVVAVGILLILSRHGAWARQQLQQGVWAWIVLLANVIITLMIIPVERPRPEYIYSLMLLIMAAAVWSVTLLARLLPLGLWRGQLAPIVMLGVLLLVPPFYADPSKIRPRTLMAEYERLRPYTSLIQQPTTVFLKGEYAGQILGYVALGKSTVLGYDVLARYDRVQRLESFLADQKVNLFFLNQSAIDQLQSIDAAQTFMNDPGMVGWRVIGQRDSGAESWRLVQKLPPGADASQARPFANVADEAVASPLRASDVADTQPGDGLLIGAGWRAPELDDARPFRRIDNGAEMVVTAPSGTIHQVMLEISMHAAPGSAPVAMELYGATGAASRAPIDAESGLQQLSLDAPVEPGRSTVYRLRAIDRTLNAPIDPQTIDLRIYSVAWGRTNG